MKKQKIDDMTLGQLKDMFKDFNIQIMLHWKVLPSTRYVNKSIIMEFDDLEKLVEEIENA